MPNGVKVPIPFTDTPVKMRTWVTGLTIAANTSLVLSDTSLGGKQFCGYRVLGIGANTTPISVTQCYISDEEAYIAIKNYSTSSSFTPTEIDILYRD